MEKKKKVFMIKAHEKVKKLPDDADAVYVYTVKAHASRIKSFKDGAGGATVVIIYVEEYGKYKDMLSEVEGYAKKRYEDDFEISYPLTTKKKQRESIFISKHGTRDTFFPGVPGISLHGDPNEINAMAVNRFDFGKTPDYRKVHEMGENNIDMDRVREYLIKKKPEETARSYKKMCELKPCADTYMEYALWLYDIKKYDDAKKQFLKVLDINPKDRFAHYHLAEIYKIEKNFEKALVHLSILLELDPKDKGIEFSYISCLVDGGKYDLAETKCRKILKEDKYNSLIRMSLVYALFHSGKLDEAQNELNKLVELEPKEGTVQKKTYNKIIAQLDIIDNKMKHKNKESDYNRRKRFKSELLDAVKFFSGRYIESITGSEGKDISKARFAKDITKAVLSVITECQMCKTGCINDISGSFEDENGKEIKKTDKLCTCVYEVCMDVFKSAGFNVELNSKWESEYICDSKSANDIACHNIACGVVDLVRHLDECNDDCINFGCGDE